MVFQSWSAKAKQTHWATAQIEAGLLWITVLHGCLSVIWGCQEILAKWPKSSGAMRTEGPGGERGHVMENCTKDKAAKVFFHSWVSGEQATFSICPGCHWPICSSTFHSTTHTHSRFLHFAELSSKTSQKGECAFRCYTTLFATASLAFNCFALLGKGQELSGRKRPWGQTWDACREDMGSIHKLMLLTSGHHFFCYGRWWSLPCAGLPFFLSGYNRVYILQMPKHVLFSTI